MSPEPYRNGDARPLPAWVDRDDFDQVAALARLEAVAVGDDPDDAEEDAAKEYLERERRRNAKESPATSRFPMTATLGWLPDASRVQAMSPPKAQTTGQRRRFIRNQVIFAASIAGFSQRNLALVFDLPHSRIAAIIAEMRALTGRK